MADSFRSKIEVEVEHVGNASVTADLTNAIKYAKIANETACITKVVSGRIISTERLLSKAEKEAEEFILEINGGVGFCTSSLIEKFAKLTPEAQAEVLKQKDKLDD